MCPGVTRLVMIRARCRTSINSQKRPVLRVPNISSALVGKDVNAGWLFRQASTDVDVCQVPFSHDDSVKSIHPHQHGIKEPNFAGGEILEYCRKRWLHSIGPSDVNGIRQKIGPRLLKVRIVLERSGFESRG